MIFKELSVAVFRFALRCVVAEIDGGIQTLPGQNIESQNIERQNIEVAKYRRGKISRLQNIERQNIEVEEYRSGKISKWQHIEHKISKW